MSEPFIGEIIMFAGNFAPKGWMFCQGQILSIAQNTALFSILGTTYGGDGVTTFALPNLSGRYPMQQGQGPGLTQRTLGEQGGSETVTLISTQMPAHTHLLGCNSGPADLTAPETAVMGAEAGGATSIYSSAGVNNTMSPLSIQAAGGSQPHDNIQPTLGITYIISLFGIFPHQ